MKILDKLKNALFEEEYVEVEEKPRPVKKDKPIAKKIVLPESKKEKKEEAVFEDDLVPKKEEKKEFKFPAILEDDFIDLTVKEEEKVKEEKKEPIKKEKPLYSSKKMKEAKEVTPYGVKDNDIKIDSYGTYEKKVEKKQFRPSPVISPVYGVLDEGVIREEIEVKKEVRIISSYSSRRLDVDSVRAKAYGSSDDIFEEELSSSDIKKEIEKEDVMLDITEDRPTVDKVTVGDAEEYFSDLGLEYNVDYKDASHEKKMGRRSDLRHEEESDDSDIEDNLFDLIDSMYEEKKSE